MIELFTEKIGDDAENNTVVVSAGSDKTDTIGASIVSEGHSPCSVDWRMLLKIQFRLDASDARQNVDCRPVVIDGPTLHGAFAISGRVCQPTTPSPTSSLLPSSCISFWLATRKLS